MLNQIIHQDDMTGAAPAPQSKTRSTGPLATGSVGGRNILSSDVEIKGKLRFTHDLVVDGRIEGEIHSEGDLTVGENAVIVGDIRTRSAVVYGRVEGNISVSDRCELKQKAALHGDVVAGKLAIEEGATFMGTSTVGTPKPGAPDSSPAPKQDGAPAEENPEG